MVGERAREGRLQTHISSGGANGFSDTMSGGNIFRTGGVLDVLRGARVRPILLYTKGGESKSSGEVLSGDRDRVGAIAIIRRVDDKGDVIRQHFVDVKDYTSISMTTKGVPSHNRERVRGGGREDFHSRRGGTG